MKHYVISGILSTCLLSSTTFALNKEKIVLVSVFF